MIHYLLPLLFIAIIYVAMIVMNERYRLFSSDHFSSNVTKVIAYLWLALLMFGLSTLVVGASLRIPTARKLSRVPFYSLFGLPPVLIVFLARWGLLPNRPPLGELFSLPPHAPCHWAPTLF